MSLNKQFLETQEQKDRLQQNVAIIKMEEKIIINEVLKLEHWVKIEFMLVFFVLMGIGGMVLWEFVF